MSDTEAKDQGGLTSRKSSRQKTPNTYYKQDISDIRGEPKSKQKQVVPKAPSKTKKKLLEKSIPIKLVSPILSQTAAQPGQFAQPQDRSKKQSFSLDLEDSNIEKASDQLESMDLESNPVSNAPERSEIQQESHSQSGGESKKSDQNNPNTSFSENDDNSNKASGGYQTRKIRKKPKFADENYLDNMPPPKAIITQKKIKSTKSPTDPALKKQPKQKNSSTGFNLGAALNLEDLQQLTTQVGSNQVGKQKIKAANPRKGEGKTVNGTEKKKDVPSKKLQETQNFLNDGILGLFLDTVNQGEKIQPTQTIENNKHHNDTQHKSFPKNNVEQKNSDNSQSTQKNNNSQSGIQNKIRKGEEDSMKHLNQLEDSTTSKKKIKTSRKSAGSEQPTVPYDTSKPQEPFSRQVVKNGIIFTYPDLNPKSEFIAKVERGTGKLVLISSSLEKTELNSAHGKDTQDDMKRKAEVKKLIIQIKQRQIQAQQQLLYEKQIQEDKQELDRQKKQEGLKDQQLLLAQQQQLQQQQQSKQSLQQQQIHQVLSQLMQNENEESQINQPISVQKTISAITQLIGKELTAPNSSNQLVLSSETINAFKLGVQQLQQKFLAEKATLLQQKAEEEQINQEEEIPDQKSDQQIGDEQINNHLEEEQEIQDSQNQVEERHQTDLTLKEPSQEQSKEEKHEIPSGIVPPDSTHNVENTLTEGNSSEIITQAPPTIKTTIISSRKSSFSAFHSIKPQVQEKVENLQQAKDQEHVDNDHKPLFQIPVEVKPESSDFINPNQQDEVHEATIVLNQNIDQNMNENTLNNSNLPTEDAPSIQQANILAEELALQ